MLLLIDTAGCGFEEQAESEGDSKANLGEAKAVMAHVQMLVRAGLPPASIGVITPYSAQVGRGAGRGEGRAHAIGVATTYSLLVRGQAWL